MTKLTEAELIEILKEVGLRVTDHRLLILSILNKSREPLTVYVLTEKARRKDDIDQATVYRNVMSLLEAGILCSFSNQGQAYYEFETGKRFCRLICEKCGAFEKLDESFFYDVLKKMLKKSKKFKASKITNLEIYGLCKKCK